MTAVSGFYTLSATHQCLFSEHCRSVGILDRKMSIKLTIILSVHNLDTLIDTPVSVFWTLRQCRDYGLESRHNPVDISGNGSSVCQSVAATDSILVTYFDTPPRQAPTETTQRLLEAGLFFPPFASMFENMGQCSSGRCCSSHGFTGARGGSRPGALRPPRCGGYRLAAGPPPGRLRCVRNGAETGC